MMRNGLFAIFDRFSLVKQHSRGPAGERDRTFTLLRILDFESSTSASSATPALRTEAKEYELRAQAQTLPTRSRGCKLRGGPKTSRRIIAFRKPDVDVSRTAISVFDCPGVRTG